MFQPLLTSRAAVFALQPAELAAYEVFYGIAGFFAVGGPGLAGQTLAQRAANLAAFIGS